MQEIARVTLHNEMDLILAHKRSMKLAELAGLSLSAQTTFATAVSEVSRSTIEHAENGCLVLCVTYGLREKYIVASVKDESESETINEGLEYAKRLVNKFRVSNSEGKTSIDLYYTIPISEKVDARKINEWKAAFQDDLPLSPYDELKQKNEQLKDLAQKLQESENQYKTLTNSLPLIIFSLNEKGEVMYANEWLYSYTERTLEQLNADKWKSVVHADDYEAFALLLNKQITAGATSIKTQCRLLHADSQTYLWHMVSITPLKDAKDNVLYWIGYIVDIHAQKVIEQTLHDNRELQETQRQLKINQTALEGNIDELNRSNYELQQFAFVASHDLQEPIRKISFYSDLFLNKYTEKLDPKGQDYLKGILSASHRMRNLINDLLSFSQVNKNKINFKYINLNQVLHDVLQDMEIAISEKKAKVEVQPFPVIEADMVMMRQLFENLIGNSLKYAREEEPPIIEITNQQVEDQLKIAVRDNGIGFDEKYLSKLFDLFQRLHSDEKYKGTGLGLAICKKIVTLHHGTITAQSKINHGSTFEIILPLKQHT